MSNFAGIEILAVMAVIVVALYYFILHKTGILKPVSTVANAPVLAHTPILPIMGAETLSQNVMTLPPPIESPEIDWEEVEYQVDDESNILLKEAERIVDKIQDAISHIASNPPNHTEVTSKIRSIVLPYQIFLETEFYDSINTYVSLAVERDCAIKLSTDDIRALWN